MLGCFQVQMISLFCNQIPGRGPLFQSFARIDERRESPAATSAATTSHAFLQRKLAFARHSMQVVELEVLWKDGHQPVFPPNCADRTLDPQPLPRQTTDIQGPTHTHMAHIFAPTSGGSAEPEMNCQLYRPRNTGRAHFSHEGV